MINKTLQNKNLQQNQHEFLIINKLKKLSNYYVYSKNKVNSEFTFLPYKNETNKKTSSILHSKKPGLFQNNSVILEPTELFWKMETERKIKKTNLIRKSTNYKLLNYFFYNNPINLIFSIDQFLFEFAKKQPQRRKSSEFQQQLKERKKLTLFYGHLSKKQLKILISQAKSYQGYFSPNFFSILEQRLDVLLYRSGLVKNICTARQLISHNKITVNNQILNIASYQVNPGDIIQIKSKNKNEIFSPSSKIILSKFRKRRSRFTISQNFIYKLQNIKNFKNYKQKKIIKNYIRLLLTKIEKRADLKINNSLFQYSFLDTKKRENLTFLKLKPLLSKQAKSFLLMCIQKNYLSLDRKPFFQNKYMRFLNLLERCVILDLRSNKLDNNSSLNEQRELRKQINRVNLKLDKENYVKNQEKNKKIIISKKNKNNKWNNSSFLKNKKQSNSNLLQSFTRKLSNWTSLQKNSLVKNSSIFNKKRTLSIYRNIVYKTLLQLYSNFLYSPYFLSVLNKKKQSNKKKIINSLSIERTKPLSADRENTLLTLKLKKYITKKRFRKQNQRALRFSIIKPIHIEVSYSMSTAILLYSPQRLSFPFYIDVDLILRSFR